MYCNSKVSGIANFSSTSIYSQDTHYPKENIPNLSGSLLDNDNILSILAAQ